MERFDVDPYRYTHYMCYRVGIFIGVMGLGRDCTLPVTDRNIYLPSYCCSVCGSRTSAKPAIMGLVVAFFLCLRHGACAVVISQLRFIINAKRGILLYEKSVVSMLRITISCNQLRMHLLAIVLYDLCAR